MKYIDIDWEFYLKKYPDLVKAGLTTEEQALKHWNTCGKNEGRQALRENAKIICTPIGIGDLIIIKQYSLTHNFSFHKIILYSKYLDYKVHKTEYKNFILSFARKLFGKTNIVFSDKYEPINMVEIHDTVKVHNLYPIYRFNYDRYSNSFLSSKPYIIFHTKYRFDTASLQNFLSLIPVLDDFFTKFKTEYNIVLFGEKEVEDNYETRTLKIETLYSILLKMGRNNTVIDLTTNNVSSINNINYFENDIHIINKADLNVTFGHGGPYCISNGFSDKTLCFIGNIRTYMPPEYEKISYRNINNFLDKLKSYEKVFSSDVLSSINTSILEEKDIMVISRNNTLSSDFLCRKFSCTLFEEKTILFNNNKLFCRTLRDNTINYLNSGALGDFIFLLYIIKMNYVNMGKKGNLYISNDSKWFLFDINHTYRDLYEFVISQEYINTFEIYNKNIHRVDINLNNWRDLPTLKNANLLKTISTLYNVPYILNSWISIPYNENYRDKIIIHKGKNRDSGQFPWETIVKRNKCFFLTYEQNMYDNFIWKNNVELCKVNSLMEMLQIIRSCKYVITNQTSVLVMAIALNKPCLAELFNGSEYQVIGLEENRNLSWIHNQKRHINNSLHENGILL
jgi:ADP-heptose:LPS heptosyltransferase